MRTIMDAGQMLRASLVAASKVLRDTIIPDYGKSWLGPEAEIYSRAQTAIDIWDTTCGQRSNRPRWIKVVEVDQTAYSATGIGLCEIGVTRIRVASIIVIRQHEIERGYSGLVLHGRDAPIWIKVAPDEIAEWIGDVG